MNWQARLLSEAELAPFSTGAGMATRVRALLAQQQATWPQLRAALAELQEVAHKSLTLNASTVRAQCNPRRIVSTGAKVDAASIQARPCFLCAENLPAEERALPFGEDFAVLCNPFPVLPGHLVIAARAHTPQALAAEFGSLLDLTRALGAEFFTLYNGPKCGASAPDHLHFQAAETAHLPIWRELEDAPLRRLKSGTSVAAFTLPDYRINLLGADCRERAALLAWFQQALTALALVTESREEPLLNLLATYKGGKDGKDDRWRILLLPRQRHRPACYDAEGDAQLTISPAALDLGGVLVVPQPAHFARLNAATLAQIYAEVTLRDDLFAAWLQQVELNCERL